MRIELSIIILDVLSNMMPIVQSTERMLSLLLKGVSSFETYPQFALLEIICTIELRVLFDGSTSHHARRGVAENSVDGKCAFHRRAAFCGSTLPEVYLLLGVLLCFSAAIIHPLHVISKAGHERACNDIPLHHSCSHLIYDICHLTQYIVKHVVSRNQLGQSHQLLLGPRSLHQQQNKRITASPPVGFRF